MTGDDDTRAEQRALAGALGDIMEGMSCPASACMDPIQFESSLPPIEVRSDIIRRIRKVRGGREPMAELFAEIAQHHPTSRVRRDPITTTIHVAFVERDQMPLGVFTMFPLEPLPANLLSGGNGLLRNLDRMAERVRDEAIAEFMATPKAALAELVVAAKAKVNADDLDLATEPERYRPLQVHPRGRWRTKKRVIRALAEDLGYPECLAVTSPWEIEGHVTAAGVRLRDFRKLCIERMRPSDGQAYKVSSRAARRAIDRAVKSGAIRTGDIPV
mgnify:FL=1